MKRIISVTIVILIAFSSLLVNRTYTAQIIPPPTQPVHNINTGLNYTTIQAAIDAPETQNGHTLRCDAGNYTEDVQVYKSLNIIGAGPPLTHGFFPTTGTDAIYINVSNVSIEGFTIQSFSGYFGVSAYKADNCSILNNVFTGSGSGILLRSSHDNTVSGNEIDSLPGDGITLTDSSQKNEIVGNSLNQDHYGIIVRDVTGYDSITNNIVSNNDNGILIDYPSSNIIVSSNFASNNSIGIHLRQASNSTVIHNTVASNSYGIYAENSANNHIYDNFLENTNNSWDNGTNSWNTTKIGLISYPNIIEDRYMAGNYWSDNPNPLNANNDGLGDVAYNVPGGTNKDNLPLVNKTQSIVKIANPQRNTWYRITRPIYANGTIGPVDPLIIDLEAIGISPGGSYNWTVSVGDTSFGEPSLVNVTWLSPEKISLTWNPPTSWDSYPWPWQTPGSFVPPLPNPYPGWPEPWFFSWSLLNITCKYTATGTSPVTDSVNVRVECGLAGEQSAETLTYGENLVGPSPIVTVPPDGPIDRNGWTAVAMDILSLYTHNDELYNELRAHLLQWELEGDPFLVNSVPINPNTSLDQSNNYSEPWHLINRTLLFVTPQPQTDFEKSWFNAAAASLNVNDVLEALRVTYYRSIWAQKTGDGDAIALQQSQFRGFFNEYIKYAQEFQDALQTVIGEVKKMGDIYISPENISDYEAGLWSEGFTSNITAIFNLFGINPSVIEQEKLIGCQFSPEKLSGNLTSILTESINAIREEDQKMTSIVYEHDNAVMDVTPLKTVIDGRIQDSSGYSYGANTNVTVYVGLVPADERNDVNVTLYANQTIIGTVTNVTLAYGNRTTITFPWNATSFAKGIYTISAHLSPVPGETDTSDNNFTMYAVTISIPGDINGDFKVDLKDLVILAKAYGTAPSGANYNPNADIAPPAFIVGLSDLVTLALHYGQHYP